MKENIKTEINKLAHRICTKDMNADEISMNLDSILACEFGVAKGIKEGVGKFNDREINKIRKFEIERLGFKKI